MIEKKANGIIKIIPQGKGRSAFEFFYAMLVVFVGFFIIAALIGGEQFGWAIFVGVIFVFLLSRREKTYIIIERSTMTVYTASNKNVIDFLKVFSARLFSNYWLSFYDDEGNEIKTFDLGVYKKGKDIQELIYILASKGVAIKVDSKLKTEGYYAPTVRKKKQNKIRQNIISLQESKNENEKNDEGTINHSNYDENERTSRRRVVENEPEKPHRQIELDDIPESTPKRKRKLEL